MALRAPFRSAFFAGLASATLALAPAPLLAAPGDDGIQSAAGIGFFEIIELGGMRMSAANIFYDERCIDPALCFTSDDMAISVVVFTDQGLRELVLRLGEPVAVPGGTIIFANPGTPPSRNGAIALERYRLEFVFIPLAPAN